MHILFSGLNPTKASNGISFFCKGVRPIVFSIFLLCYYYNYLYYLVLLLWQIFSLIPAICKKSDLFQNHKFYKIEIHFFFKMQPRRGQIKVYQLIDAPNVSKGREAWVGKSLIFSVPLIQVNNLVIYVSPSQKRK